MKIFITGIAGFIGSHLAEHLSAKGHSVSGIDSFSPYYDREFKAANATDLEAKGIKVVEADIISADLSLIIDPETEIIYHCAAQPGISERVSFDEYLNDNLLATRRLAEFAASLGKIKIFVNISTSSVYGALAVGGEDTPPAPISHYGVTKLAGEQYVLALSRNGKLPACSVRPFSIYGPRERPEKMCFKFIESLLNDEEFPLFEGSGKHRRSFTNVGDLVEGLERVAGHIAESQGEIFNMGNPDSVTVGEVISMIEKVAGKAGRFAARPRRVGDQDETKAVIDKARRILGFQPKISLEEGLRRQFEWQRARRRPMVN
jgi:nucleoside-diphosphate-sugar epimerase